ncbi:hypothetical protein ACFY05_31970 [Microtetraspora fusca]|uniref:Uncharacterized protein n=1 Tax=Microtetraspora fusca TaxID=1997 RepID=A0ABW6VDQ3_MICFU
MSSAAQRRKEKAQAKKAWHQNRIDEAPDRRTRLMRATDQLASALKRLPDQEADRLADEVIAYLARKSDSANRRRHAR